MNTEQHSQTITLQVVEAEVLLANLPDHGKRVTPPAEHLPALYALERMYVAGEFALLASHNNLFLKETSPYPLGPTIAALQESGPAPETWETLPGESMVLCGWWSNEFFHWMLEWLPMVVVAELHGFKGKYVIRSKPAFIKESLLLLGIDESRIVERSNLFFRPELLYVCGYFRATHLDQYPSMMREMRSRMISNSLKTLQGQEIPNNPLLYLARNSPNRPRRLVNAEEVLGILKDYGFYVTEAENKSLAQQILQVHNTKCFVTPHGAGMVHTLFMPARSTVIELFSPNYVNACLVQVASLLAQRYHMIVSHVDGGYEFGDDIRVTPALLRQVLDRELRDSNAQIPVFNNYAAIS